MEKEVELDEEGILFNWIKDTYGTKCKHYEKDCACCVAWELYMRLVQIKPLISPDFKIKGKRR